LKSPIAGKLGQIQAVLGQSLPPGTAVADVVSLDEIDVLCFVPSDVAARLQLEQPARITRLDNATLEKESSPTGKVVFIAVQGQAATGMFGVKVRFPNPDHKLRANAVVKLQVQTDHKKNALAIPAVALSADQEPPTVILVAQEKNKEGKELVKARVLQADVGIRDRAQNLVELRGLKDPETKQDVPLRDDMQFVIEGGIGLETGDLLAVQKEEKEKEK
jgi:multidrug efflux pump subunit AcrA (membrane-fusion protein)